MQFLVSAKWIEGEAKERGVSATPAEVERQFEQTKDQSFPNEKAYQRFLKTSGQTEEDLQFRVTPRRPRQQDPPAGDRESSQNVSDSEIEEYYNENEQQFSQPERRDLEIVLDQEAGRGRRGQAARRGRRELGRGRQGPFDDPASKEQGGKLLGVTKGQQDRKLDAAVFAAVEKKVAGPIKTDAGYYVFRVTKVTQGLEAGPRPVQAGHPAAAGLTEAAEGAGQLLHQLPQRVARAHRLRERLRDPRLPQRPRPGPGRGAGRAARPEAADHRLDRCEPAGPRRHGLEPRRRQRRRHGDRQRPGGRGGGWPVRPCRRSRRRRPQQAPLALGGAPKEGAGALPAACPRRPGLDPGRSRRSGAAPGPAADSRPLRRPATKSAGAAGRGRAALDGAARARLDHAAPAARVPLGS